MKPGSVSAAPHVAARPKHHGTKPSLSAQLATSAVTTAQAPTVRVTVKRTPAAGRVSVQDYSRGWRTLAIFSLPHTSKRSVSHSFVLPRAAMGQHTYRVVLTKRAKTLATKALTLQSFGSVPIISLVRAHLKNGNLGVYDGGSGTAMIGSTPFTYNWNGQSTTTSMQDGWANVFTLAHSSCRSVDATVAAAPMPAEGAPGHTTTLRGVVNGVTRATYAWPTGGVGRLSFSTPLHSSVALQINEPDATNFYGNGTAQCLTSTGEM